MWSNIFLLSVCTIDACQSRSRTIVCYLYPVHFSFSYSRRSIGCVCVCVCAVYCVLICFCSIDKLRISIVVFCNCASRNGILLELKRDPFRYNNCTFVNFRLFTNWRIEFDPIRLRSEGCSTHFKREREIKKNDEFRKANIPRWINIYLCLPIVPCR